MMMRGLVLAMSVLSLFAGLTTDLFEAANPDSIMVLVNREHKLEHTFEPKELVLPAVQAAPKKENAIYLRDEAAHALEDLFVAAAWEGGHTLYAVSGYRSYALQKSIFSRKVDAVGEKRAMLTVAPPGASEHQLGLAMDINGTTTLSQGLVEAFGESPEGEWVKNNAHRFGFIIRYQQGKTDITGYAWEPWHLRYVGKEAAEEVFKLNVTFEEYHQILEQRRLDALTNPSQRGDELK